ncbi:MAG: UDP-N-acetylmuramoyl-tripeptide--D-alanyl-D-alanine ligase [Thermoleophilaceae bacterium]|nr:UDP-N-acetylmuramoyl-tripeptide--D-alanyl-D-alanine ligase [Thermoleophilaceae bacterium]
MNFDAPRIAQVTGARLVDPSPGAPSRVVIDSRAVQEGDLFVGLVGENVDGGRFAEGALEAGAWGVLVGPGHGVSRRALVADDPLVALQRLATAWRRELGAQVIAITGSVGKTTTKDLTAALIAPHRRVHFSRANFNTEIGLPLELLAAPEGTEVVVLEMGMRGLGQIAELAEIAEPDVGVITNIGPVHLELVGSLDGVARAKGELLEALPDGGTAVVPAGEPRLEPMLRPGLRVVRFGDGDEVSLDGLELPFASAHMRRNAQAAVAAARAVGVEPSGRVEVQLSALRGERVELPGGAIVINDCYNANPLSMRAALDDLAAQTPTGRRVAVLGDMLELGPDEVALHREIGAHAAASGVDLLVTVGPLAAEMAGSFGGEATSVASAAEAALALRPVLRRGDLVLVKASRGVGLEAVAEELSAPAPARDGAAG